MPVLSAPAVDDLLTAELAARRAQVADIDLRLVPAVDRLIAFTLNGGKRLRPQFLWWGWRAAGGEPTGDRARSALRAGAALELIQACALVHDDIIDNSATRRGAPSMHVLTGVPNAILLGDLALAWADDLFAAAALELSSPTEALAAWRAMRTEVLAGQLLDVLTADNPTADPVRQAADARLVNRYKTAAYTVERPLHLGAALAGSVAPAVAALRAYGTAVGIAFQLRDDLLGVFGDAAVTGKPAGGDLVEGKQTELLAAARSRLADRRALLGELDAGIGTVQEPAAVARLAGIIADSGAPDRMEAEIAALVESGLAALDEPALEPSGVAALRQLAVAATARVT